MGCNLWDPFQGRGREPGMEQCPGRKQLPPAPSSDPFLPPPDPRAPSRMRLQQWGATLDSPTCHRSWNSPLTRAEAPVCPSVQFLHHRSQSTPREHFLQATFHCERAWKTYICRGSIRACVGASPQHRHPPNLHPPGRLVSKTPVPAAGDYKSRMRGPLGERNQMGCLLPHASFSFQPQLWKHGGWRVGLAAPSEACIWIPLRRVGAPPLGGRVSAGAQQPARLTADQCAWPSPFRPTTHLKVIRR